MAVYDHVRVPGRHGSFEPRIGQRVSNLASLLGVVAAGLSLALVPTSLARVCVSSALPFGA